MSNTERERKLLALLLGVMVLGLTLFVGILGSDVYTYSRTIDGVEMYAQASLERYLRLAININDGFLVTISGDWQSYLQHTSEVDFRIFSESFLVPLLPSAYFSVILTSCGDRFYNHEEYSLLHIDLYSIPVDGTTAIFYDDPSLPFGSAERLYIAGRPLQYNEDTYYVYVGFFEPLMISNFIDSLDREAIGMIQGGLKRTMTTVIYLMAFVIISGFILVYHALKLKVTVYKDIVSEMGGKPGGRRLYDPREDSA